MRYQLRDYRITSGAMTQFVSEWRAGVRPLRSQAGFEIVGAWSNPETYRFVWVVAHQGDFEEADRMYYESPDRSRLSPDPARFIEEAHAEFLPQNLSHTNGNLESHGRADHARRRAILGRSEIWAETPGNRCYGADL